MRKFFRSITNLSLLQQLTVIIFTFGFVLILFFSVYLRNNINRFVDDQVCEGDIRPFSGKFKGNGFADSACGARDERYFSV